MLVGFIEDTVDVKDDGNYGYCVIVALLGLGEDSWSLVRNHLLKELGQWCDDYIVLFGGINRYEHLKYSYLLMDYPRNISFCYTLMDKYHHHHHHHHHYYYYYYYYID